MPSTSTLDRVKRFSDKRSKYILQTTKNRLLFAKEHTHVFYELIYVMVGRCIHSVECCPLEMSEGDFIIIRPGVRHAIVEAESGTDILCISISAEEYRKYELLYGNTVSGANARHSTVRLPRRAGAAVGELLREEEIYTDHLISAVCSVLLSEYAAAECRSDTERPESLSVMMEKMELDISLQREGVTAMTRLAGYSVSQLTRLMKRHCSTTPHEYLKELRLTTSFKLVTETDISLESIAYECGYRCYGYFTDVFKDKYGMTPAALRKSEKK